MPAFYCESSGLVKAYVVEQGTSWIRSLVDVDAGSTVYVSRLVIVEVASALARRVRDGSLSSADAQQALASLQNDIGGHFEVIEVTPAIVSDAVALTQRHALRAYDAVQLATALHVKAKRVSQGLPVSTVLCSDVRLVAACQAEGLATDDPNLH